MLAPTFGRRAEIVPAPDGGEEEIRRPPPPEGAEPPAASRRFPRASLLWRVLLTDGLACPACDGRTRIVAVVTSKSGVTRFLGHARLPTEPPRFHAPRPPPQDALPFDDTGPRAADPLWDFEPDPPRDSDFEN